MARTFIKNKKEAIKMRKNYVLAGLSSKLREEGVGGAANLGLPLNFPVSTNLLEIWGNAVEREFIS